MIKYCISIIVCLFATFIPSSKNEKPDFDISELYLSDVEEQLGVDLSTKKPDLTLPGVSVKAGESLIKNGFIPKDLGRKAGKQSKHFVCTSCHNIQREDPDLAMPDPQARLDYAVSKGLPFLQGSPLYGVINRSTYYNGDYQTKYGDLALKAKNNIREAIQLCAQECAQGRKLANWEVESILAYFWTIGIKIKDLKISEVENTAIKQAVNDKDTIMKTKALELLSLKYADKSEATFIPPPDNRKTGNGLEGNVINGEKIYKFSCLHCHQNQKYSFLDLDESAISLNYLKRHLSTYHRQSIYQVTRWGVPVFSGKKSYMPQYPVERLSEQQLADLVAYIKQ
jgi:mono/diheme cytochrome c family protein